MCLDHVPKNHRDNDIPTQGRENILSDISYIDMGSASGGITRQDFSVTSGQILCMVCRP